MQHSIDITGQRFGRLTVLQRADDLRTAAGNFYKRWHVRCDCGAEKILPTAQLRHGGTLSCGCLRREATIGPNIKHGEGGRSKSAEYRIWVAMRNRCNNPKDSRYDDYGGRDIKVCARWNSFPDFLADVGRRPSPKHSLDRYPDNDGNYEPGNVRWATPAQQRANQRRRLRIDQFTDAELFAELARRGYHNPLRVPQHH